MSVKEIAREIVDALPEEATLDELIHALYLRAKFDRGEQEIREGQGVPHEEARVRVQQWVE